MNPQRAVNQSAGVGMTPPKGKGFGSAVLEQVMAEYFVTPPQIEFAADGVGYEMVGSAGSHCDPSRSFDVAGCPVATASYQRTMRCDRR